MTLSEYLAIQDAEHTVQKVAQRAGLRWATVRDIAQRKVVPRVSTARKIEAATGGAVSAAEVLGLGAEAAE